MICSSLQAETGRLQAKKVYIDKEVISILENGIFIKTEEGSIKVKGLRSDKHGVYILVKNASLIAKKGASCQFCYKIFYSEERCDQHESICPLNPNNH